MKEILRDLLQDLNVKSNPQTLFLLGKPATQHEPQRPSAQIMAQFCTANNIVEPSDVDTAIRMARI
jgi:hypothetical protein